MMEMERMMTMRVMVKKFKWAKQMGTYAFWKVKTGLCFELALWFDGKLEIWLNEGANILFTIWKSTW